ncbi:MAG: histidine kinase [Spirulinaceae cyanobacterium RM2_2_10]|nr:histidine kinase [Spirulinaceae cyanobacterium SM2_1_0]NJO18833.1 histidine kinase [Spirulinaceae cyanobacterium RM2_2_10]
MDTANQQKILGYFIEEAKEHLETLGQGLMDLSKVVDDPEGLNELFRAAHSVKGGSAMLGYNSIQRAAHRLEDGFKILKDHPVPVDQKLESLFLKGYDTLQELITQLESPFGLRDEDADRITSETEADFAELEHYLNQLLSGGAPTPPPAPTPALSASVAPVALSSLTAAQVALAEQIKTLLKEMLALFKQKPSPATRKQLQNRCARLAKLAPQTRPWQVLTKSCYQAIANPKFAFRTLAPVTLQELKQGGDRLVLGQADNIQTSEMLQQLAKAKQPQVLVPVEPKAAAQVLRQAFNDKQLAQLAQLLVKRA